MKKNLYYAVASWSEPPSEVFIRSAYTLAVSEAEARGQMLGYLDRNTPNYTRGRGFSVVVTPIPDDTVRDVFGAQLGIDFDKLTEIQKFALLVLRNNDLTGAKALIDKLAEAGAIDLDAKRDQSGATS